MKDKLNSDVLKNNEKYKSIFENCLDAVLLTGPDGKIYSANKAAQNMFGRTEEELILLGRDSTVEKTDPRLPLAIKEREEKGEYFGELTQVRKDGTKFPAEISSSVFLDDKGRRLTSMIIRDITERKKVEKALEVSEERLRLASEATGFGIFSYEFESGNAYYSPEFLRIYGLSPGDTIELDQDLVAKAMFPEDKPRFLHAMQQANNPCGSGILDIEFRIFRPDKSLRWLRTRGLTIFSGQSATDQPLYANGILQDITEQKQTEISLRESEARFRGLFENSLLGISIASPEGKLLQTNHAYALMYGYENPEKMLAEVTNVGMLYAHKKEREDVLRILRREGKMEPKEIEVVRKDGTRFFVLVSASEVRDTEGQLIFNQAFHIDLTERKKTEEKIRIASHYARTLIETSLDPLVTISAEGKITDINFATERITGLPRNKLIGSNFSDYFTEPVKANQGYNKVFSKGVVKDYPLILLHKSGRKKDVLYNASLFKNEAGEVQGVFAAARDVTKMKKMEDNLRQSKKSLEKLSQHLHEVIEKERSQIAMNLHDDLGQKLTALNLDLAWLKSRIGVQSQLVRKKLEEMSLMINNTIESIKEISSSLRPSILFDLGLVPAISQQLKNFEKLTHIKCIFIYNQEEFKIDDQISLILFRLFQEATTNIARHSKASEVEVSLTLMKNKIELLVNDNGIGIEEEKINNISSLGIAGMKERVMSVNGKLLISGNKTTGTLVKVSIPLKRAGKL